MGVQRVSSRWIDRHWPDVAGIALLMGVVLAFLSPALKDGVSIGGFDLDIPLTPLGAGLYGVVHNHFNGDAVSQMVSWNALNWRMVHSGHFPLWNDYSVLGMPQFLNFESSVLSLPDLVSYAVPIRFAFLVVVAVKLLIAGTGTYFLLRVLRCGAIAATFSGISFMLAGAFVNWVTWPLTDVVAWTGWVCAFAVLAWRSPRRPIYVGGLAVVVAFSIYGGFPEANIMVAFALFGIGIGAGATMVIARRSLHPFGLARVAIGGVLGILLATPLWLPGLQVISGSHRQTEGHYVGLPTRTIGLLLSQGYFGMPIGASPTFELRGWNYYESVAYVGVFAIALGLVALLTTYRRPLVIGLAVAIALSFLLTYEPRAFHPLQSLVNSISPLSMVRFERMRSVTAFLVAVLAGLGLDRVIVDGDALRTRRAIRVATGLVAVAVVYMAADSATAHLAPRIRHQRFDSLVWPIALVVVLLAVALIVEMRARLQQGTTLRQLARAAPLVLLAGQGCFLFFAGVGIPSYSKTFYPASASEQRLASIVGTNLVGLDGGNTSNVRSFAHVGFYPNVNIGYGIKIFGVHDPLVPTSYFTSWPFPSAAPAARGVSLFVPAITSASLARHYGVSYVLAAPNVRPTGMVPVVSLAGEELYRVAGSQRFQFLDPTKGTTILSDQEVAPGRWNLAVRVSKRSVIVFRVTSVPGWHATIDGRPLALHNFEGVMQSADIPGGRHTIDLWYFPDQLKLGLLVALIAALVLVGWTATSAVLRRRSRA